MNEATENALGELDKFAINVANCFDLAGDQTFITYCFGVRELIDVVKCACTVDEHKPQVSDKLERSLQFLNSEIEVMSKRISKAGMAPEQFQEYSRRLEVFYEIDRSLRWCDELITTSIDDCIEETKKYVLEKYELSKDFSGWKRLKPAVFEYFTNETTDEMEESGSLSDFAREDGVVSSLSLMKAKNDIEKKKKTMLVKLEKVLNNFVGKNPDPKTMKELIDDPTDFEIDDTEADLVIERFLHVWEMALNGFGISKAVQPLFMDLMKRAFLLLSDKKKEVFEIKVFEKYYALGNVLPSLHSHIEHYQARLTSVLNQLPTDHQQINSDPESFEKIKNELVWYIFVSAEMTLSLIFGQCVQNKALVPIIIKICRSIPSLWLVKAAVKQGCADNYQIEPILVTVLRKLFMKGRGISTNHAWTNGEEWENAAYLAMSFTKPRKSKSGEILEQPLLESYELINLAIIELFHNKNSHKSVETFTKILQRLLANNANNKGGANYSFSNKFSKENEVGVIAAPELLKLMYDMLVKYDGRQGDVADHCRDIIKAVGGRLEDENIVFDKETIAYLTTKCFNNSPWWVKYSIFTWYRTALNQPKRQIPSGVYIALTESEKDNFEQIVTSDQASAVECYLKSFFELGLFDVDLSIDLLNKGYDHHLEDIQVVEKIALALVDCYGKKLSRKRGGKEIPRLVQQMLRIIDPTRSFGNLEVWSKCFFDAVHKIDHLILMAKAVKIAFEKKLSAWNGGVSGSSERTYDELSNIVEVASELLDIYCIVTKEFLDVQTKEANDFKEETRRSLFQNPEISDKLWMNKLEEERMEKTLIMQMSLIFAESATFTRFHKKIPISLQQLLVTIVQETQNLQSSVANRALDEYLTKESRIEVVHAFNKCLPETETAEKNRVVYSLEFPSEGSIDQEGSTSNGYNGDTERQSTTTNTQRNYNGSSNMNHNQHSVENELFNYARVLDTRYGKNVRPSQQHRGPPISSNYQGSDGRISHRRLSEKEMIESEDESKQGSLHIYNNSSQSGFSDQSYSSSMAGSSRNHISMKSRGGNNMSRGGRGGRSRVWDSHSLRPSDREEFNRTYKNGSSRPYTRNQSEREDENGRRRESSYDDFRNKGNERMDDFRRKNNRISPSRQSNTSLPLRGSHLNRGGQRNYYIPQMK